MNYLFLICFIAVSAVHLYASAKSDKRLRAQTKGFILPFLLFWYLFSVQEPSVSVIAAIVFSWLGDVLLIFKGVKWFTAGGISFEVSHVFFIISYISNIDFSLIPLWVIIVLGLIYLILCISVFRGLKPYLPKVLFVAMFIYLMINATQNCFAFYRMLSLKNLAGVITFVGTTLFFVSDSTLFYVRFKKDGKERNHFVVMLTYIVAEFLIVLGLMLNC